MEEDFLDDYLATLGLFYKQTITCVDGKAHCYSNQGSITRLFYRPGKTQILVYRFLSKCYYEEWQLNLDLAHPESLKLLEKFLEESLTTKEAGHLGAIDITPFG